VHQIVNSISIILRCHGQVKIILNFSNGTPYFLFHILVADIETFSKHWLHTFFQNTGYIRIFWIMGFEIYSTDGINFIQGKSRGSYSVGFTSCACVHVRPCVRV